jgi:hypothetical protein
MPKKTIAIRITLTASMAVAVTAIASIYFEVTKQKLISEPLLSWRAVCGSSVLPSASRVWFAVRVSSKNLLEAKRVCGDAFVQANGDVQYASFVDRAGAEDFASKLKRAGLRAEVFEVWN